MRSGPATTTMSHKHRGEGRSFAPGNPLPLTLSSPRAPRWRPGGGTRRLRGRSRAWMDASGHVVVAEEVAAGRGGSGRPSAGRQGCGTQLREHASPPGTRHCAGRPLWGASATGRGGKRVAAPPRTRPQDGHIVASRLSVAPRLSVVRQHVVAGRHMDDRAAAGSARPQHPRCRHD